MYRSMKSTSKSTFYVLYIDMYVCIHFILWINWLPAESITESDIFLITGIDQSTFIFLTDGQ